MNSVKLKIANIIIEVVSETANLDFRDDQAHIKFIVNDGTPHIRLSAHYGKIPEITLGDPVFNSESVWKLYSDGKTMNFTFSSPPDAENPYCVAVIDNDFTMGDIYLSDNAVPAGCNTPNPLNYPLDELIMLSILSKGYGIILHSACIADGTKGLLFTGTSGAGKSTISEIWRGKEGINVLTDERVIIRKENGSFFAYGTPWNGTSRIPSPGKAELKGIYFIKHGKENQAKELNRIDATSRFIARGFPTYWDKEGMQFSLDFASEVVESVPCYELAFKPDDKIINYVRSIS